jgi:rhomboid protease GluP
LISTVAIEANHGKPSGFLQGRVLAFAVAKFRISYNAPVVLTFALLAVFVQLLGTKVNTEWFATHGNLEGTSAWVGLITHILGHSGWDHLIGNFMLILLLGPLLEERLGSLPLLIMILITAVFSGLIDVALGDRTLGASGIVFMMILLASTANIRQGEIPLTFIAVAVIYLGGEVMKAFDKDNISQLGHILGGLSGAVFGFLSAKGKPADASMGLGAGSPMKDPRAGAPIKPRPKLGS